MAEIPTSDMVVNDLASALDAYEAHGPGALIALCRRLMLLVADRAGAAATNANRTLGAGSAASALRPWLGVMQAMAAVPKCQVCGGLGAVTVRASRPVPCPACGG